MKKIIITLTVLISINTYSQSLTSNTKKEIFLHKKEITHNNYDLDNTINLTEVDIVPIYDGCQDKDSKTAKINCLNTNLAVNATSKFINSGIISKSKLKRGNKRIRVVFIIDENGSIKVKNILGKWSEPIINEVKKAVENSPKLTPAIHLEKKIPVKYSIQICFTV